jgi:hypothetical protein
VAAFFKIKKEKIMSLVSIEIKSPISLPLCDGSGRSADYKVGQHLIKPEVLDDKRFKIFFNAGEVEILHGRKMKKEEMPAELIKPLTEPAKPNADDLAAKAYLEDQDKRQTKEKTAKLKEVKKVEEPKDKKAAPKLFGKDIKDKTNAVVSSVKKTVLNRG